MQKNLLALTILLFSIVTSSPCLEVRDVGGQSCLCPSLKTPLELKDSFLKHQYLFEKYNPEQMLQLLLDWVKKSCPVRLQPNNAWEGKIVAFMGDAELKLTGHAFRGMILDGDQLARILLEGIKVSDYHRGYFYASDIPWGGFFFGLQPFFQADIFYKYARPLENYYSIVFQFNTQGMGRDYDSFLGRILRDIPPSKFRLFIFNKNRIIFEELPEKVINQLRSDTIQQAV